MGPYLPTRVGSFLQAVIPSTSSCVALTATLAAGAATTGVCKSLGMQGNCFTLIRRSNERPNVQLIVQALAQGLNGPEFPFLLPYLASGRKTVIHVRTIDVLHRVFMYLWRIIPSGSDKLRRVRMYHKIGQSILHSTNVLL